MLYTVLYISKAKKALSQQELSSLLDESRRWNEDHDLTGFLAYVSGNVLNDHNNQFIQVLEGAKSDVDEIFDHIKEDSRHSEVNVIKKGQISRRKFSLWKMGFENLEINSNVSLQSFFSMDMGLLSRHGDADNNILMDFMKSFYEKGD